MKNRIILRKLMLLSTALVVVIGFQNCAQDVNFKTANNTSTFNNDYYEAVFKTSNITEKQTSVVVGSNGIEVPLTLDAVTRAHSETFEQITRPSYTDMFKQGHKASMHNETFTQKSNNGLLDILIVIDDSGSMSDEQNHLAERMDPLLSAIKDTDWRIGVVTTRPNHQCMRAVINKNDANNVNDFKNAIQAGASGGTELGVDNALLGLRCTTPAWVRADSSLALLFVTDEDDDSAAKQANLFNEFTSMGRTVGQDARVYGILNLSALGHYDDIINASNGIYGSIASSDYSDILTRISQDVSTILKNQFELAAKPNQGSLNIMVNGTAWTGNYTVNERTLTFTDTLPPEGSNIQVSYSSGGAPIMRAFTLSQQPLETSLAVTVNGQAMPMEQISYDKTNNQVVFNTMPAESSNIVVNYKENMPLIESFKLANAQVIPESINVKIGSTPRSDIMYNNQDSSISFKTPIPEGMSLSVSYQEFVSPQLEYNPSLVGDGVNILSVVDADSGAPVSHTYMNGKIQIPQNEYVYKRALKVRYSNNQMNTAQIALDQNAVLESIQLSGNAQSCQLLTQPTTSLYCNTDRPLSVSVSYITEVPVTEFTLQINPFLDPNQGEWLVMDTNGNPVANYTRTDNVISFDRPVNVSDLVVRFVPNEIKLASN